VPREVAQSAAQLPALRDNVEVNGLCIPTGWRRVGVNLK
jgi:hypothetical protein